VRRAPSSVRGAVLLLLCAFARICAAAQPGARPAGPAVELMIGAAANEAELLESSIREMLVAKGLGVATTRKALVTAQDVAAAIAPPKEAMPSRARVLLDFTVKGQATLFLIDPPRGRVYVRRIALPHGLDAVARASVRFVVEQSIDAILEGREIGVSREEFQRGALPSPAASVAPPAPPAAPASTGTQLQIAGGYEAVAMGSGEFQQAAKLAIAARVARVVIAAAARLAAPMSISGDGVQTRLSTVGVGASVAGRFLSLGSLSMIAGLGAGVDFTRVATGIAPADAPPDLRPAAPFWAVAPWLKPFVGIERLFGRISVAVAVGAEIHLLDERYTVKVGTATREVFVPGRLRPEAEVLVGVAF
jgi:hypothetical protein